jgi:hypothetical protein
MKERNNSAYRLKIRVTLLNCLTKTLHIVYRGKLILSDFVNNEEMLLLVLFIADNMTILFQKGQSTIFVDFCFFIK